MEKLSPTARAEKFVTEAGLTLSKRIHNKL
jgi:hypothetical protein